MRAGQCERHAVAASPSRAERPRRASGTRASRCRRGDTVAPRPTVIDASWTTFGRRALPARFGTGIASTHDK